MSRAVDTPTARRVLVAMIFANGMILVDQTAVPLALPAIMQDLGVRSQAVQWLLNGSLLPLAGLLVFGGRIGDLLGRRRMFLLGSALFAGASASIDSTGTAAAATRGGPAMSSVTRVTHRGLS